MRPVPVRLPVPQDWGPLHPAKTERTTMTPELTALALSGLVQAVLFVLFAGPANRGKFTVNLNLAQ